MERRFHVVFTGRLHAGFRQNETVERMSRLFHLDRQKVADLLSSGKPVIMKQGLSWKEAQKYCHHLEQIGLQMKSVEVDAQGQTTPSSFTASFKPEKEISPPANQLSPTGNPAVGVTDMAWKGQEQHFVEERSEAPSNAAEQVDDAFLTPSKVENSHGWLWIKNAFGMLFRQPLTWAMMMSLFLIILFPLVSINPFGFLVIAILTPIFHGGILLGAQQQKEGGKARISHLFHGFSRNISQLLLVGLANLVFWTALTIITLLGITKITLHATGQNTLVIFPSIVQDLPLYLAGLIGLAMIAVVLLMACWFAPCLITLDKSSAFAGFRMSFKAVRMNGLAFMIYGLAIFFLGLLFFFFYGAAAALFSLLLGSEHIFLSMLLPTVSAALVAIPMTAVLPLSVYTGYRDIFHRQLQ